MGLTMMKHAHADSHHEHGQALKTERHQSQVLHRGIMHPYNLQHAKP